MSARTARTPVRTFSINRFLLWSTVAAVAIGILVAVGIANRSVPPAVTDAPSYNVIAVGDPAPPINVRYPVAYDESLAVAKSYLQGGYPTIAIIRTNKHIAYIGSGEIARKTVDLEIRRLLK